MTIFAPKKGAVLSWSRVVHCLLAATITAYGGHLFGYQGSVTIGFAAIVAGFIWEAASKAIDPKGWHPYGDAWDFWAFVIGATLAGIGWLIIGN